MRIIAALVALALPATTLASETYANPYEAECRTELGFTGNIVPPGLPRAKLRNCIRRKTTEARRAGTLTNTHRDRVRQKQQTENIQQKAEEKINQSFDAVLTPVKTTAQMLEKLCREELNLGKQKLQPGPMKGNLIKCIRLKTATRKKEQDVRRKRSTVQRRQGSLFQKVLSKQVSDEKDAQKERFTKVRNRLQSQTKVDPKQFRTIRDSFKVRTDFRRPRSYRSRTNRNKRAAECRTVAASQWAACIQRALERE